MSSQPTLPIESVIVSSLDAMFPSQPISDNHHQENEPTTTPVQPCKRKKTEPVQSCKRKKPEMDKIDNPVPRKSVQGPLPPWTQEHEEKLNRAALSFIASHMSEVLEREPELEPWKHKGRIHEKLRQMFAKAPGGGQEKKKEPKKQTANKPKEKDSKMSIDSLCTSDDDDGDSNTN